MKCTNCQKTMFQTPLHRTNPKGQPDAGWMCEECIKLKEPELHANLEAEDDFKVVHDIHEAINEVKDPSRYKSLEELEINSHLIGPLQTDEDGNEFRMVNGKQIGQIKEDTPEARETNRLINLYRMRNR